MVCALHTATSKCLEVCNCATTHTTVTHPHEIEVRIERVNQRRWSFARRARMMSHTHATPTRRGARGAGAGGGRAARAEVRFARAMLSHLSATQEPRATVQCKILLVSPTISKNLKAPWPIHAQRTPPCTPHKSARDQSPPAQRMPSPPYMMKARRGSPQEPPPCAPGFVQVQEQSAAAIWIVALRPLQPGVELGHRGSGRRSRRPTENAAAREDYS